MNRLITFQAYHIKKEREEEFLATWRLINDLYFRYAGCSEARIHREDYVYYEYLSWPDELSFQRSKSALPPAALALKARLRACCSKTEDLIEMELVINQRSQGVKPFS